MKLSALILLLGGCAGVSPLKPDHFNVEFGRGSSSSDGSIGPDARARPVSEDGDVSWVAIGWTWDLTRHEDQEERKASEQRYLAALYGLKQPAPTQCACPAREQSPPAQPATPNESGSRAAAAVASPSPPVEEKKSGEPFPWAAVISGGVTVLLAVIAAFKYRSYRKGKEAPDEPDQPQ